MSLDSLVLVESVGCLNFLETLQGSIWFKAHDKLLRKFQGACWTPCPPKIDSCHNPMLDSAQL